jgi:hypothetical protein
MEHIIIIITIILIAVALIITLFNMRVKKRINKEAEEFLNSIEQIIYDAFIDVVESMNFTDDVSKDVAIALYYTNCCSEARKIIMRESVSAVEREELSKDARSILTKEYLTEYIEKLMDKYLITERISNCWESYRINSTYDSMVEEDQKLAEKISDSSLYNVGEFNEKTDLEPVDLSNLNNSSEEEDPDDVDYDMDDDTVELVGEDGLTDSERDAGVHFDKNGRKHGKNGRFI